MRVKRAGRWCLATAKGQLPLPRPLGATALGGKRVCALVACAIFISGALVCALWQPDEKLIDSRLSRQSSSANLSRQPSAASPTPPVQMERSTGEGGSGGGGGSGVAHRPGGHKYDHGVKYVRVEVASGGGSSVLENCGPCGRGARSLWLLLVYLAKFNVVPLLALNFFFRFAFAAYKSNFPYLCFT